MKLVGMLQNYNEAQDGNLERCLTNMSKFCDDIVVLDDASTDNSVEIIKKFTSHIIYNTVNQKRMNETSNRQKLVDYSISLDCDWMVWLDGDEIFDRSGEEHAIRDLMKFDVEGYSFLEYQLWKSLDKYRVDELWAKLWMPRMWRNKEIMTIEQISGLHQNQWPVNLHQVIKSDIKCIHFGFSSEEKINQQYEIYKSLGQTGQWLERIKDETGIILKDFDREWYPRWMLN